MGGGTWKTCFEWRDSRVNEMDDSIEFFFGDDVGFVDVFGGGFAGS